MYPCCASISASISLPIAMLLFFYFAIDVCLVSYDLLLFCYFAIDDCIVITYCYYAILLPKNVLCYPLLCCNFATENCALRSEIDATLGNKVQSLVAKYQE